MKFKISLWGFYIIINWLTWSALKVHIMSHILMRTAAVGAYDEERNLIVLAFISLAHQVEQVSVRNWVVMACEANHLSSL